MNNYRNVNGMASIKDNYKLPDLVLWQAPAEEMEALQRS